jgi:hypothetical protein
MGDLSELNTEYELPIHLNGHMCLNIIIIINDT